MGAGAAQDGDAMTPLRQLWRRLQGTSARLEGARVLPALRVSTMIAFTESSFVWPEPWQTAVGALAETGDSVCRVGFGVSPLRDRIYVDGLYVHEGHRQRGCAAALLLAVVDLISVDGDPRLSLTPLHEVGTSTAFWHVLRQGRVPGLLVTRDVRVSEMAAESQRWKDRRSQSL